MFAFLTKLFSALTGAASRALAPGQDVALVGLHALDMILGFEGVDQAWRWPGESSGVTLGHGFDLGYCTAGEFTTAWSRHLPPVDMARLRAVIGLTGEKAKKAAVGLEGITRITAAMADEVFQRCTLPKFQRLTRSTFPGLEVLTPDQQGVLVSLVFNRGASLKRSDPRRREMVEIADILKAEAPAGDKARYIAQRILEMRRLWPDSVGLLRRRTAEAKLMCPGIA